MEHEQTYGAWFRQADADHDGRVTGQDAVAFFAKSGLPKDVLAKVWALGDTGRQGYLGKKEFLRSMAAISLAQNGQPLTLENVEQSLASSGQPLAVMQGLEAANTAEANPFSDPFKEAFKVPDATENRPNPELDRMSSELDRMSSELERLSSQSAQQSARLELATSQLQSKIDTLADQHQEYLADRQRGEEFIEEKIYRALKKIFYTYKEYACSIKNHTSFKSHCKSH